MTVAAKVGWRVVDAMGDATAVGWRDEAVLAAVVGSVDGVTAADDSDDGAAEGSNEATVGCCEVAVEGTEVGKLDNDAADGAVEGTTDADAGASDGSNNVAVGASVGGGESEGVSTEADADGASEGTNDEAEPDPNSTTDGEALGANVGTNGRSDVIPRSSFFA